MSTATSPSSSYFIPQNRTLKSSKTLPYSPSTTFNALSDISAYSNATSLIHNSKVTSHSPTTTKATFQIGYPSLSLHETWTAHITIANPTTITITQSGASETGSTVVESYKMQWTVSPVTGDKGKANVNLVLEVKFRGIVVDSMFAVLPGVAERTMERFEGLVKERDGREKAKAKDGAGSKGAQSVAKAGQQLPAKSTQRAAKGNVEVAAAAAVTEKKAPRKLEVRSGGNQAAASS